MIKAPSYEYKKALEHRSHAFLEIVSRSLRCFHDPIEVEKALALWCYNQPPWYQAYVYQTLGKTPQSFQPASAYACRKKVRTLANKLYDSNATCLFLLEDGRTLAEAYSELGTIPLFVRFSRVSLPGDKLLSYFHMFDIVNRAARQAENDWRTFLQEYKRLLHDFLQADPFGRCINGILRRCIQEHSVSIQNSIAESRPIIIADSGIQGTFALAISTWIEDCFQIPEKDIDIHLLVVYPWLKELFKGRFESTDATILAVLEGISLTYPALTGNDERSKV